MRTSSCVRAHSQFATIPGAIALTLRECIDRYPMAGERILIVEDDPQIAEVLSAYLLREGYQTMHCLDGSEALRTFAQWQPDLVLLDYMLPRLSGNEVLAAMRRSSDVPVIMVTAVNDEAEKLGALRYGADDYVVKPFNPKEVVARVQVVLRRARGASQKSQPRLVCGVVEVDLDAVLAHVIGDATPLELTITEFKILSTLMRHPSKAFTRFELLQACLPESDALERVVDTHVHNLRRKLEERGVTGVPLAVRGVGYRLGTPQ